MQALIVKIDSGCITTVQNSMNRSVVKVQKSQSPLMAAFTFNFRCSKNLVQIENVSVHMYAVNPIRSGCWDRLQRRVALIIDDVDFTYFVDTRVNRGFCSVMLPRVAHVNLLNGMIFTLCSREHRLKRLLLCAHAYLRPHLRKRSTYRQRIPDIDRVIHGPQDMDIVPPRTLAANAQIGAPLH